MYMYVPLQSELMEEQRHRDMEEEQQYYEKVCTNTYCRVSTVHSVLWEMASFIITAQVKQLHFMEEKAKIDFDNLVNRTSNHEVLQVNFCNTLNHNVFGMSSYIYMTLYIPGS